MTTDYKTVFQLAKSKGFILLLFPNGKSKDLPVQLLELTLIQKWLRDEHKIFVTIDQLQIGDLYQHVIKWHNGIAFLEQYGKGSNSYESALLEGINEALKLI